MHSKPLFEQLLERRLGKAIKIGNERGNQYGDTLANGQWLVTLSVLREFWSWGLNIGDFEINERGTDLARALAIAGLVDVKYQRFEGGFKEDHLDDGINYQAVLAELMKELHAVFNHS